MRKTTKSQWIKFIIISFIYLLFTVWVGNYWLLLGIPVIFDIYVSKFIPWGGWKKSKNKTIRTIGDWADAIIFALIAVTIINLFVFQNYKIPTSSLEKSLLVGDFLFVSKVNYGPRVPNTPLAFPLVQNTIPILNCKSYSETPHWDYHRLKGLGHVKRNDIVVFNFPAGDTIAFLAQNPDYYSWCQQIGRELIPRPQADTSGLSLEQINQYYANCQGAGRTYIQTHEQDLGKVMYRPVDRRENYVKRCIGMPGDSLQIIDCSVYINGEKMENPKHMQLNYFVETNGLQLTEKQFRALNVSKEDRKFIQPNAGYMNMIGVQPANAHVYGQPPVYNPVYNIPLTKEAYEKLQRSGWAKTIIREPEFFGGDMYYPVDYETGWRRDNYGPVWIPAKGATVELTPLNMALYSRCIRNFEGNDLKVEGNKIFINGQETNQYTFKYDYYFMMGDNRHKSADSRSWGFVPEDHVVGEPLLVWLSLDKDRGLFDGAIRWNRLFRTVGSLK